MTICTSIFENAYSNLLRFSVLAYLTYSLMFFDYKVKDGEKSNKTIIIVME